MSSRCRNHGDERTPARRDAQVAPPSRHVPRAALLWNSGRRCLHSGKKKAETSTLTDWLFCETRCTGGRQSPLNLSRWGHLKARRVSRRSPARPWPLPFELAANREERTLIAQPCDELHSNWQCASGKSGGQGDGGLSSDVGEREKTVVVMNHLGPLPGIQVSSTRIVGTMLRSGVGAGWCQQQVVLIKERGSRSADAVELVDDCEQSRGRYRFSMLIGGPGHTLKILRDTGFDQAGLPRCLPRVQ